LDSNRRISLAAGLLFLLTFATSIAALALFQPVLDHPVGYVAGTGADNRIVLGAFLELLLIVANIGTAVVLFPILRRQNEIFALGYVTARLVECALIAVGILAVLTIVTLEQERTGADAGAIAYALAALKDWTFDVFDQGGTGQSIAAIPEFFWELGLGLWLTFKGFRPSPILSRHDQGLFDVPAPVR
jgi:hypothetical protein